MAAGWFFGSPTIYNSTLVRYDPLGYDHGDGVYTAFDLLTGEFLWDYVVHDGQLSEKVETGSNDSVLIFLTFKTIGEFDSRVISVLDSVTGVDILDQTDELAIDAVSDGERLFYLTAHAPYNQAHTMLKSVDLQSGATRFLVDFDGVGHLVGVADNSVVTIDERGYESRTTTFRAFDSSDGRLLWSRELNGAGNFGTPANLINGSDLILAHDDGFAILDLGTGSVKYEALLPILDSEYSISDTGWCPEGDYLHSSLQESEGIIALETCVNAVAVIDLAQFTGSSATQR